MLQQVTVILDGRSLGCAAKNPGAPYKLTIY